MLALRHSVFKWRLWNYSDVLAWESSQKRDQSIRNNLILQIVVWTKYPKRIESTCVTPILAIGNSSLSYLGNPLIREIISLVLFFSLQKIKTFKLEDDVTLTHSYFYKGGETTMNNLPILTWSTHNRGTSGGLHFQKSPANEGIVQVLLFQGTQHDGNMIVLCIFS